MNTKLLITTISIIFVYTVVLMCLGVFGQSIQDTAINVSLFILKYASIIFGYFLAAWLPYRIITQVKRNQEFKEKWKKQMAERAKKTKQQKIEEQIENAYLKAEDSI